MPVVAVLVGLQASGKTTFYRDVLGERYLQASKDRFPNAGNRQQGQLRLVREALAAARDAVIDNTNPSPAEWQPLVRQPGPADGFDGVLTVRFDGSGGFEVSPCPVEVPGGC